MNSESTNRRFEDTNFLERKIVYRNSFDLTFTLVGGIYSATYTDTKKVFPYSNNNFTFDYFIKYNDGSKNRVLRDGYTSIDPASSTSPQSVYAQLFKSTIGGVDYLNMYTAVSLSSIPSVTYTFYYILYSSRYYDLPL